VQVDASTWRATFDTSQTGLLAYQRSGTSADSRLEWFSRTGQSLSVLERQAEMFGLRLSPEGNALAAIGGPRSDLWIYELKKRNRRRMTFGPSIVYAPVWSPDATRVAFSSDRLGGAFADLYVKSSNGAGDEELLIKSEETQTPTDWSPDGRFLAYNQYDPRGETRRDIWLLALQNRKPYAFRQTESGEADAQFSPDGKWVAYTLTGGRDDIFVVPFRDPTAGATDEGGRWQVSNNGGSFSRWRQDGRELFYLNPEGYLMAAEVDASGPSFDVKAVRRLFRVFARPLTINQGFPYDVSPDGQTFIVNMTTPQVSRPIVLVANWTAATRR
jgi:Tol biopolymer transport system component